MKQVVKHHSALLCYGVAAVSFMLLLWLPFANVVKLLDYEQAVEQIQPLLEQDALQVQDAKFIRRNYGISSNQYEKAYVVRKHAAMDVEEIAIFQASDAKSKEVIAKACEKRVQQQIESFTGYGEAQVAILEKAVLLQNEQMVILIIHADSQSIRQLFLQDVQKEEV